MKKIFRLLVICLVFCLCSCDITSKLTYYSVAVIDDGEVVESRALLKGSSYTLPTPQKEDGFKGWKVGDSSSLLSSGSNLKITSNTTITAVREESSIMYCSLVVLSKGNVVESKVIVKDSDYVLPPSPSGTGFKGWRINNSTTLRKSGESIKISEDTEVTACWNDDGKVNCSVVVLNKGELLESKIVLSDSVYTLPATPAGEGFKGWRAGDSDTLYKSGTSLKITSDTTITAIWTETPLPEPVYYAVAVVDNGAIVDALAVKEGDSYTLPSPTSRGGYCFNGWKVGEDSSYLNAGDTITITGNTSIKADWTKFYILLVEVPQNVINAEYILVEIDEKTSLFSEYYNYSGANNGYYQYMFILLDLAEGEHTLLVNAAPSGVNKKVTFVADESAEDSISIRLADKSEVIDLNEISISVTARVDSKYNLTGSTVFNTPSGVTIFYTTDGSDPRYRGNVYQEWKTISIPNGTRLNTYASTSGKLASGSRYKSINIELSVIGARGPAGGYIFYDKGEVSDGWRMMETGRYRLSSLYQWGSYTTAVNTSVGLGCGKSNTAAIIDAKNADSSLSFPAAEAVWNVDVFNDGYKDWFLPSTMEMDKMYTVLKNLGLAGPLSEVGNCWSSTSYDTYNALYMNMYQGDCNNMPRQGGAYIWPIRQF